MVKQRVTAFALAAACLLSSTALAAEDPAPAGQESGTAETAGTQEPGGSEPEKTEEPDGPEESEEPGKPEGADTPASGPLLASDDHVSYMSGSGGLFHPDSNISRAEAAQILYRLLPQHPAGAAASYTDVAADAWYAQAALELGSLGVIRPGETEFLPNETLSRSEFVRYLAFFFTPRTDAAQFTDVPAEHPNAAYLLSARAWGWLSGFADGSVHPDEPITRAEAVALVNRAVGRAPDKTYIDSAHPVFYLDVSPGSWYYYDVVEASVSHEHTGSGETEQWTSHTAVPSEFSDGFYLTDGWLYYFDSSRNDFVRSDSVGNWTFNADGHFTTGSDELDNHLRYIVMNVTDAGMTQEQKLRALYVYTRDSFQYLRRPPYQFGVLDYMQKDALTILTTGYGNCYCYASLFWYLSRWIGYDAQIYNGTVGVRRSPHSWVEIAFNGRPYIFDTELEMAYHKRGRYDINLYKYIDVDGWRYVK